MEKRQFNRFEIPGASAQYKKLKSSGRFFGLSKRCNIANMSKFGMCIYLDEILHTGDVLMTKIFLPDGSRLRLKGKILWQAESAEGAPLAGIQFFPFGSTKNQNPVSALRILRSLEEQNVKKPDSSKAGN